MLLALALLAAAPPPLRPRHPTPRSAPPRSGSRRRWWRCAGTCTPTPSSATARSAPAGLVAERLRGLGLEVRYPVAKTGVVGILRGGRPGRVVALRADIDALPIEETSDLPFRSQVKGVMHACGHDAHTAILLGAVEVLAAPEGRACPAPSSSSSSPPRRARPRARKAERRSW